MFERFERYSNRTSNRVEPRTVRYRFGPNRNTRAVVVQYSVHWHIFTQFTGTSSHSPLAHLHTVHWHIFTVHWHIFTQSTGTSSHSPLAHLHKILLHVQHFLQLVLRINMCAASSLPKVVTKGQDCLATLWRRLEYRWRCQSMLSRVA